MVAVVCVCVGGVGGMRAVLGLGDLAQPWGAADFRAHLAWVCGCN